MTAIHRAHTLSMRSLAVERPTRERVEAGSSSAAFWTMPQFWTTISIRVMVRTALKLLRNVRRIIAYGSRVLVANNVIPRGKKNFTHRQDTNAKGKAQKFVMFDYGNTCGIDINKDMLASAANDGMCPGYFEEGIVVRDNYVFNHGHKGYNIAGNWVTITGNRNERLYLKSGADVYNLGTGWVLTHDGYELSGREFRQPLAGLRSGGPTPLGRWEQVQQHRIITRQRRRRHLCQGQWRHKYLLLGHHP